VDKRQEIGKPMQCPVRGLVIALVMIEKDGNDRFYLLTWRTLRGLVKKNYTEYLRKHDGVRPKKWRFVYVVLTEKELLPCRDKWETIVKCLK
jgi:hypothetical protein